MLTTILQSCAAAVAVTVTAFFTWVLLKMIPNPAERAKETAHKNQLNTIETRCLRAAEAQEKSAYHLARIADQLEKNGK